MAVVACAPDMQLEACHGMYVQTTLASPQPAPQRRIRAHSKCSESGMGTELCPKGMV